MKVLDVTEFYSQRGGGVRSHLTLKEHISRQLGHEVIVLAPGPKDGASDHGVRTIPGPAMPYDPSYHLLWRIDKIRAEIARVHPDVLEIHSPYVAALGCLAAKRGSFRARTFFWHSDFIDTYREVLATKMPYAPIARAVEPLWGWVRRIGRGCGATIASSRVMADKLRAHGVPRVELIPFGVDKMLFRPQARSEATRARLLDGSPGPLFVGVGRFAIEKQWDVVIRAFARIRETLPGARLWLFGDGPERESLERMAREVEHVQFAGFVRDRAELASTLASADVLLHGCPFETFGIGVAEAVACGLPIVVPDRGGAAEQATGASARTFASGEASACAAAAIELARAGTTIADAASAAARAVPTIEDHFRALYALYARLLDRSPEPG
jgi:alpha-1,6-mannosyltransferase